MQDDVHVDIDHAQMPMNYQMTPRQTMQAGARSLSLQPFQYVPVPFAPDILMQAGHSSRSSISSASSTPVHKPIAQHAIALPLNSNFQNFAESSWSLQSGIEDISQKRRTSSFSSSISRSSSICSSSLSPMERQLSTSLTLNDSGHTAARRNTPNYLNSRRVSAHRTLPSHYGAVRTPPVNAGVLLPNQMQWTPGSMNSLSKTPQSRVTWAVADLPSYGRAPVRRCSALSATKKRKRSANITDLKFSRHYKPNEPPYNLIRIWVNDRNMQFYDCECGKRKAVQDLQKILRHVEKCYSKNSNPSRKDASLTQDPTAATSPMES